MNCCVVCHATKTQRVRFSAVLLDRDRKKSRKENTLEIQELKHYGCFLEQRTRLQNMSLLATRGHKKGPIAEVAAPEQLPSQLYVIFSKLQPLYNTVHRKHSTSFRSVSVIWSVKLLPANEKHCMVGGYTSRKEIYRSPSSRRLARCKLWKLFGTSYWILRIIDWNYRRTLVECPLNNIPN